MQGTKQKTKTINSIETKELYDIQKAIEKKRAKTEKMIEKRRTLLERYRQQAMEREASRIKGRYEKKLSAFILKRQKKLETFERTVLGKKIPKRLNVKINWKSKAFSIFQRYIRLLKSENGYVTTIDDGNIRRRNGCDAGHCYPKHNFPQLAFYEDNVRPQTKNNNKMQGDSIGSWREKIKDIVGDSRYIALIQLAENKEAKYETIRNSQIDRNYYENIYHFYKKLVDELEEKLGIK